MDYISYLVCNKMIRSAPQLVLHYTSNCKKTKNEQLERKRQLKQKLKLSTVVAMLLNEK